MTKTPHRPASKPDGGGALRFAQPRGPDGRFIELGAATTPPVAVKPPAPEKPVARQRAASPEQLVRRVTRAIERELTQIEDIVGVPRRGSKRTDAEKRVRTLASLARTLAEVTRLRNATQDAKADHDDDDAVPRDLDEFRQTLERRLALMAERRQAELDRGDDAG